VNPNGHDYRSLIRTLNKTREHRPAIAVGTKSEIASERMNLTEERIGRNMAHQRMFPRVVS